MSSNDIAPGRGIEYRGHRVVRADTRALALDVFRGERHLDRLWPAGLGSLRVVGQRIDALVAVDVQDRPPIGREATLQLRELQ